MYVQARDDGCCTLTRDTGAFLEGRFVFPKRLEVLSSFIQHKSAGDKNTNVLGLLLKRQSGVGVNPNGG